VFRLASVLLLAIALVACGTSTATEPTPTLLPEPPVEEGTPESRPTPTPRVEAPTTLPDFLNLSTPVAATPTLEPTNGNETGNNGEQTQPDAQPDNPSGETEELLPTVTPIPTVVIEIPTATVRPTATPQWRPAKRPDDVVSYGAFHLTGPTIRSGTLSMSAVIDNHTVAPTEVQVWETLRRDDSGGKCPSSRPIALIADTSGGGSSQIQWQFCSYYPAKPVTQVSSVPWLSGSWSYSQRTRRRTTEPLLADWSMSASLNNDLVEDLRYSRPEGYTIVIFAGDLLLDKVWLEY